MADNELTRRGALQLQPNALTPLAPPQLALVGPTALDDIQRAIWRHGAEAVKKAVKEATKAKLGRKREPDMVELRDVITADAHDWLAGKNPFAARSNYAIAKDFAERNPDHSAISTHKRIERKLSRGPYDRRWYTLVTAENLKGEQTVKVVHVYPGGQAVVADTFNAGGGFHADHAEQSDGPDVAAALSPAMLGQDTQGCGVPIPGGIGETTLPDARRHEPRCTERQSERPKARAQIGGDLGDDG